VKDRLIAAYFVNDVQREIFEGLSSDRSLSEVIDELDRRGEEEAAHVLSQLAVDELDREYTVEDVTAVVSQLIRSAVTIELKNVARDLNDGTMAPEVADVTVRDVKERLVLLESPSGQLAENELREWLLERNIVKVVVTGQTLVVIGGLEMTAPLSVEEERSLYPLIQQGRRAEQLLERGSTDATERRRLLRQRHAGQEAESKLLRATLDWFERGSSNEGIVRQRRTGGGRCRGTRQRTPEVRSRARQPILHVRQLLDHEIGQSGGAATGRSDRLRDATDTEVAKADASQSHEAADQTRRRPGARSFAGEGVRNDATHRELQSRRYGTTELDEDTDFKMRRDASEPPSWVIDALRRICGDDFDAFWQFTFRTMSIDEIARAQGISRQGMTKRIARCRRLVGESSDAERLLQWFAQQ